MKRLLLLLFVCCTAVACEQTPSYMRIDIEKSVSDGWYKYAGTRGIEYTDGKVNGMIDIEGGLLNIRGYYRVENMVPIAYSINKCHTCGAQSAFTYSIPFDLDNKQIMGYEILQFNEDAIIYIEPLQIAIERCNNDKDFWRAYTVYTRKTPSDEELQAFESAINSNDERQQFIDLHSPCKVN